MNKKIKSLIETLDIDNIKLAYQMSKGLGIKTSKIKKILKKALYNSILFTTRGYTNIYSGVSFSSLLVFVIDASKVYRIYIVFTYNQNTFNPVDNFLRFDILISNEMVHHEKKQINEVIDYQQMYDIFDNYVDHIVSDIIKECKI